MFACMGRWWRLAVEGEQDLGPARGRGLEWRGPCRRGLCGTASLFGAFLQGRPLCVLCCVLIVCLPVVCSRITAVEALEHHWFKLAAAEAAMVGCAA